MSHPFEGCWAKWERGQHHVDAIQAHIDELIGPLASRRVAFEPRLESRTPLRETWIFEGPSEIPDLSPVSVEIGDALNCFRGALDHLAWATTKRLGTPVSRLKEAQRRQVSFPLASSWGKYPGAFKRGLPGVSGNSAMGRLVKSYQPCGRGRRAGVMRALRDLNNRDKHRLLIPAVWLPEGWIHELRASAGVSILSTELLIDTSRPVPLKPNQPLVRVSYTTHTLMSKTHVNLDAKAEFVPAIGRRWWLMLSLQGISSEVLVLLRRAAIAQDLPTDDAPKPFGPAPDASIGLSHD